MIFCFRTSFPVLEHPFPVLERLFPVLERLFSVFLFFWEGYFVPGRDRGVCPGTFAPALVPGQRDKNFFLSRDKGTTGRLLETLLQMDFAVEKIGKEMAVMDYLVENLLMFAF